MAKKERCAALYEISMVDFLLMDMKLYLDTHPTDRNVMIMFNQYRDSYNQALDAYKSKYGSMSLEDTSSTSGYWMWNKSPWPWEVE